LSNQLNPAFVIAGHRRRLLWGASVLSLTFACAVPAAAQQAQAAAKPALPPGSFQVADAAAAAGVEEIVVSARRREENAQDVPIAITAISSKSLARDNTDFVVKLSQKVPSISAFWSNPKQVLIGLRGIGSNAGNNDGLDPSVGVFIDGVYLGRTGQVGFNGNFEDVDNLQVLRGPQGTLFGKNTTAGAILIASKAPNFRPEASAEAVFGNYNLRQIRGVISGPIVADKLALRLSAYDNSRDGTYDDVTTGAKLNEQNNWGVRAQALFTPTSTLRIRLIAQHDEISQAQQPSVYLGDGPVRAGTKSYSQRLIPLGFTPVVDPFAYRVYQDAALFATADQNTYTGQVDWTLPGNYKLTSISGYRDYHFVPQNDFDYTPLLIERQGGTTNDLTQWSQEVRLASPSHNQIFGQNIDWVVGAFYFQQKLKGVNRAIWGPLQYYIATPPAGTTPAQFDNINYGYNALGKIRSYALFGQATWHITPKWELTGGLRPTWETKSATTTQYLTNPGGLTAAQVASVFGVTYGTAAGSVDSENVSWLGSLAYKLTPQTLLYGSVSRGYKSAAANIGVFSPQQVLAGAKTTIPGEEATSYELGFKSLTFSKQLQLNIAVFDSEISNYQTTIQSVDDAAAVNPRGVTFLAAIPGVRSRGIEVETTIAPDAIPGLTVDASVSYVKATYKDFKNAPCPVEIAATLPSTQVCYYDLSGKRLEQIPEWSANVSAEYEHPISAGVTGYAVAQYSYKSDNYLAPSDSITGYTDGYGLANFRVGARWSRYDVSAWINNAFNEEYFVNSITAQVGGAIRGTPGDPQTFGFSLKAHY
jgi:iron complex outermembrane receptor protein